MNIKQGIKIKGDELHGQESSGATLSCGELT